MTDETDGEAPPTATATVTGDDADDRLLAYERRTAHLADVEGLLTWDQWAAMPDGGGPARARQREVVSAVRQERRAASERGDLLAAVDADALSPDRRAAFREIRRDYERAAAVPAALAAELSAVTTEATEVWGEAADDGDWGAVTDYLARILDLKRREATAVRGQDGSVVDPEDPYAALVAEYAPCVDLGTAERIFDRLRGPLADLVAGVRQSEADPTTDAFSGTYDADREAAAARDLLDGLGLDADRAHVESGVPASTFGNQFDCRVGVSTYPDDLYTTLDLTVHEFGHALYTQQLPRAHYGTPLGADRGIAVQESQAIFWECHVARTPAFWEWAHPVLCDHLALDATPRECYESFTRVRPDEPNSLRGDELTWPLHDLVRVEIERDLLSGDLDPTDVPAVWNRTYREYLGVAPADPSDGPLVTPHWAMGYLGYFPTYTLGQVLAAQFAAAAREDLADFDGLIARGEFGPIREWLGEHVHRHGRRYTTPELVRRATGEAPTADYFLDHVRERYGRLYGL